MAWIDYQKAFVSVPRSWIIKSLELIVINNKKISFTKETMSYCKTSMCLNTGEKVRETEDLETYRGISQADSLSRLLFCIRLIPLTGQLNKVNTGHEVHTTKIKVSH